MWFRDVEADLETIIIYNDSVSQFGKYSVKIYMLKILEHIIWEIIFQTIVVASRENGTKLDVFSFTKIMERDIYNS